jgi:hypothetical protein
VEVIIGLVLTFLASIGAAIFSYFSARRSSSGSVHTSEADSLWLQTQHMIDSLQHDKERAEDQRDKLLDITTNYYTPQIEKMADNQLRTLRLLEKILGKLDDARNAD